MNWDALDFSILWPAMAAGLLVTATHVPLGMQVLVRGIVFIDIAIAQIAGCGVLLADKMGFEAEGVAAQVAALGAALGGALLLTWTERVWPEVQEAVIGVVFVLAATGGVLLLASNPHGSEHLRDLLVGQILWVKKGQLALAAVAYAAHPRRLVPLGRAAGARGLLRALRARRHRERAAGRPLPRVRDPDRAAARDAGDGGGAARGGVGNRRRGLRRGAAVSTMADLPSGPAIVWAIVGVALLFSSSNSSAASRPARGAGGFGRVGAAPGAVSRAGGARRSRRSRARRAPPCDRLSERLAAWIM